MKRIMSIAIGALALTACGSKTIYVVSTDAPTTTLKIPKTTDAPIAVAPEWTTEDEFIFDIEENYGNTIYSSDKELLDTGYATCEALQTGSTAYDILSSITNSADGDPDIELLLTSVVASAVVNLCPEQEWKFNT